MIGKSKYLFAIFPLAIFLASCSHYEKQNQRAPIIELGQSQTAILNAKIEKVALSKWWLSLDDETLISLIETALKNNLEMQLGLERLKEARAILDVNNYALGPSGKVSAGGAANRLSEKGALPIDKIPGFKRDQTLFRYGYDASWEIDFSGGIRNAIDAADAKLLALEFENNGIRITIAAETGRAYFEAMGALSEKELVENYLNNLDESLNLIQKRVKAGDLSHKDYDDLRAKREQYKTQIPAIDARFNAAKIALAKILGQNPESLNYLAQKKPENPKLIAFPIGARSELLLRRPDIRAAETMLKMRASEVKYYEAEHFPKFKINAHAGWEAINLLDLFNSNTQVLNIGPSIEWNIFDSGRIDAQINAALSREEQSYLTYKNIVIGAISDSERALSDYKSALDALEARKDVTLAQNHLLAHQQKRFKLGDASKLEVLDAERQTIETQIQNVRTQTMGASSMIGLFKALGGGWEAND